MTIPDSVILELIAQVNQIEEELGPDPSGVYSDIRVRLDILESRINNPLSPSPNVPNPFTIGFDGVTISTGAGVPTENRLPGSLYLRTDGYADEGVYSRRPDGYWHKVSSSGGGSGVQALTNIAALSAVAVTSVDDGTLAYILSVKDLWIYHTASVLTPDGVTIAAANGPGNWERSNLGSVEFRTQAVWYIDSVAGNDENNGLTSGTALKSFYELSRRWGPNPFIPQLTDVYFLSDHPGVDPITLDNISAFNLLNFHGFRTTIASGTLTNYTPASFGANLAQIEDTGLGGFGPYLGNRIRFTSGLATDLVAWIQRDDGASKATIMTPSGYLSLADAAPGDSYVIENLSQLAIGNILAVDTVSTIISFLDFTLFNTMSTTPEIIINGCNVNNLGILACNIVILQSSTMPFEILKTSEALLSNVASFTTPFIYTSLINVTNDCAAIGFGIFNIAAQSLVAINSGIGISIQDVGGVGLSVGPNSSLLISSGSLIWGSNVDIGFSLTEGGQIKTDQEESPFPLPEDFLVVATVSANVVLDGIKKTYSELPYANKLTGSCVDAWQIYASGSLFDTYATPLITTNENDYNAEGDEAGWTRAETVILQSSMAVDITGFAAIFCDVNKKTIINGGSFNITLKHLNVGSFSNNQIKNPGNVDLVLGPNDAVDIFYDSPGLKWRTV